MRSDFDVSIDEEDRREQQAIARMVEAVRANDVAAFVQGIDGIESTVFGWRRLFRQLGRIESEITPEFSGMIERLFAECGDTIRQEVGEDLLTIRVLRRLILPYVGPELTLYRGETFNNRSYRRYGYSWTMSREVGYGFATGLMQTTHGGSVLLETVAPASAIIAVRSDGRFDHEQEVWVDRRFLNKVIVLERFPQRSWH